MSEMYCFASRQTSLRVVIMCVSASGLRFVLLCICTIHVLYTDSQYHALMICIVTYMYYTLH